MLGRLYGECMGGASGSATLLGGGIDVDRVGESGALVSSELMINCWCGASASTQP